MAANNEILATGNCFHFFSPCDSTASIIYWKLQTNHWFFDSYGNNFGEGFEFLHPYLLEVLFSFRSDCLYIPQSCCLRWSGFIHLKNIKLPYFMRFLFIL